MNEALATLPHEPARQIPPRHRWYRHLYVQVLIAVVIGILLGHFYPTLGEAMKPLGDNFLKLVKLVIASLIFCTVVHGIASMRDISRGRSVVPVPAPWISGERSENANRQ